MARRNVGESSSIALAIGTAAGLIVWTAVTHFRVNVDVGFLPPPGHWATGALPVWAALIVTCIQMILLGWAIVKSTSDQAMGIVDEFVSYANFAVPAVILLLVGVGVVKSGHNHINGVIAFLVGNFAEMVVTKCGWTVANRRPGGVIGGGSSNA